MKKFAKSLLASGLASCAFMAPAHANSLSVSGTIYQQAGGTTFDRWHLNVLGAGSLKVDVLGYEATQKQTSTAGYAEKDLNGDGEITFLDPEVTLYTDDGHLDAIDNLARCDDIGNHCDTFTNANLTMTDAGSTGADGSVFLRDPAFKLDLTAGGAYLLLIADYYLKPTEAETGINTGDSLTLPAGLAARDHADYRITFSSDTLNFAVNGNTITVSQVPVPGAVWLFGSAVAGLGLTGRRRKIAG